MEKRVSLEKRGRTPSQIKELVLDSCRSTSISGLTDEFCNLEKLSMLNVGLTNLKGFPKLPNLKKLELSDNRISGGLNHISTNCPKLKALHLSGNKIDSLEVLESLKELTNLEYLDLHNCEVTATENYKEKVFAMLPNLKYLDGFDQNDVEAESEESDTENGKVNADGSGSKDLDDSDLDDEDEDEEDEDESEGEVGLSYLQKNQIDEESEGDDYSPEGEGSDVEIDDSDEEGESAARGEKRKLEEEDDDDEDE